MNTVSIIVSLIIWFVAAAGLWKVFAKIGATPWTSLIPILSGWNLGSALAGTGLGAVYAIAEAAQIWLACVESVNENLALILIVCLAALVVEFVVMNKLAKKFGKGTGYTLGLVFLPFIFTLILGFGSAQPVDEA